MLYLIKYIHWRVHFLCCCAEKQKNTFITSPFSFSFQHFIYFNFSNREEQSANQISTSSSQNVFCGLLFILFNYVEFLCSLAIEKRLQRRGFDSAVDRQLVKLISLSPPAP